MQSSSEDVLSGLRLAGRLGAREKSILNDERLDPAICKLLESMPDAAGSLDLDINMAIEEALEVAMIGEELRASTHAIEFSAMPDFSGVSKRTMFIPGEGGHEISLFIYEPAKKLEPSPCIVHLHGGAMVFFTAADPQYVRLCSTMASHGLTVVSVEFRNAGGKLGPFPFPSGLDDCCTAIKWIFENKQELKVSKVIVSGESGGGNLSLAATLRAKSEGWGDFIDGVYACCPYIYGAYSKPNPDLVSLEENKNYGPRTDQMVLLSRLYDPSGGNLENPLAWPFHASLEDLSGLPPHVISVNELDPLRDEGISYYRKLKSAGVCADGRIVLGTNHAADVSLPDTIPDIYDATIRSIVSFSFSL